MPDQPGQPSPTICCVIPVFNNAGTIRDVVRGCLAHTPDVLVVDDTSTDASLAELLSGESVTVLTHPVNRGKGTAILTALERAAALGFSHILTLDGDGQHSPDDIPALIQATRDNPDAIVVGRRNFNTPNVPRSSRFGRAFSNFWIRLETGAEAGDSQSGLRVYPVAHLRRLGFRGGRYEFEIEVLTRAAWAGLPLVPVDVSVTYFPPERIRSSFRPFLDNLRISLMHSRLVGRRLVPWPHRRLLPRPKHPLHGLLHPKAFMVSLLRESATPPGLAASAGIGILLGALPLISLHTLTIVYVTSRLNLNRLMAVLVSNLCMAPLVPALCVEVGHYMRHGRWLTEFSRQVLLHQAHERLWEWLLGSLVLGPILAVLVAIPVFVMARIWQKQREPPHA